MRSRVLLVVLMISMPLVSSASSAPADSIGATNVAQPDLFFAKTGGVGSGKVEVHSATAASGYQTGQHSVTWFDPADAANGTFQMVGPDLCFIKTGGVGSGKVEVHSATAASGYQTGQHSVTWFDPADAANGTFQMVGPDLYFIKTALLGSGKIEVHSATAASGYQTGQHFVTWFDPADAANGTFQMVGPDLYFIKTALLGSGKVEVHSATAASGYQTGQHSVTWFDPTDAANGTFQMVGPDVSFIKTAFLGSGKIEVHSATAASGYQTGQHSVTWFDPTDAANGTFTLEPNNPPPLVPPFVRFGPTNRRLVALTIDDIFGVTGATRLNGTLAVAESRGVHLTFFPTGGALEQHHAAGLDWIWQRAVRDLDEIGNHTYTHRALTKLTNQEIRNELTIDEQKLAAVLGPGLSYHMTLMRPPGGAGGTGNGDPRILRVVNSMGYSMVMWTIEPNGTRTEQQFIAKILKQARPGSIVLMHFTQISPAGIATVIDGLRARGLEPTTVSGLYR